MAETTTLAPLYRYITADLLSGDIIAEIPYRGVSYGRALRGAGAFQGKIPVITQTEALSLYKNTTPGQTALYVVRNGICVWGGIIWDRSYTATTQDLTVSASEFTSYLYRRVIWKTWNHKHGATLAISGGEGKVIFNYGSNTVVAPGSSVHIDLFNPSDFQYNGYYRVASSPTPTLSGFTVVGGTAIADIASVEVSAGTATITTNSMHGFGSGDLITVDSGYGAPFDGTFQITASEGSNSLTFTYPVTSADVVRTADSGEAVRPIPDGVYTDVTVAVRADTWDYVRSLLDSTFNDFVGTEFPNAFIEPGVQYGRDVTSKKLDGGYATITTNGSHNLAVGQAAQVQDVGSNFNGEFEVVAIPATNKFMYTAGGAISETAVEPTEKVVTGVSLLANVATVTTSTAHTFSVGNVVNVFAGYAFDSLNGDNTVTAVPSTTTFQYVVSSPLTAPERTFPNAVVGTTPVIAAKIVSNVATLTLGEDHTYESGDSVVVGDVDRTVVVTRKALDAPNNSATVYTDGPHHFENGSAVTISGLKDISTLAQKTNTTSAVTFTTKTGHNFAVGDTVDIVNYMDMYNVSNKQLVSNVATITTPHVHNVLDASEIFVESLVDNYTVTDKVMDDNIVTLTVDSAHNFIVNDEITVLGVVDTESVVSTMAENGIAILTLAAPHNFLEAEEVTITGVGAPFNGTVTLLAVTDTRVLYEVENNDSLVLPSTSGGLVTGTNSAFNGVFTLTDVSSTTLSFSQVGNDVASIAASGTAGGLSILNGTHTVTGVTSTTIQYSVTGEDVASSSVPVADEDGEIQAVVYQPSRHLGAWELTSISRDTFTFAQSALVADSVTREVSGQASIDSIFNGARTLTSVFDDSFKFTLSATSNVIEETSVLYATATSTIIFDGTYTLTAADTVTRTVSYALTYADMPNFAVQGYGTAVVKPTAVISTFGPFPGNSSIGIEYSTRKYSGKNVNPVAYRGYELNNVGEALDQYSDSLNGFEYRIDCSFDVDTQLFVKKFVLIPIDFPNPPAAGEVSDTSRFGADKLVFEYPGGSITTLTLSESANEAATRFFAVGEGEFGPEIGPNISIAAADGLLSGADGRRWPILDDSEKIDGVYDEPHLYTYAQRYLSESRPPDAKFSVSVNGSIPPLVGTYAPGDWCSLIIDDPFIQMRLASSLEPRDNVIVRKIDAYTVTVPDSVTYPEKVDLTLVAEWEVDKRG